MQLPLIPVEQFLAEHPEHADADENALTIARIEHEHAERLALEEQRQGLLKKKQGLIADNKKRKDDLANLDKDLEKFIDVSLVSLKDIMMLTNYVRLPNRFRRLSRKSFEHMIAGQCHGLCAG
jgi:dGTP triphosphohydrolase